jgi:methylthioribose-1-phosphate isomerase
MKLQGGGEDTTINILNTNPKFPTMKLQGGGKDTTINILTHCNAGWLAFVDNGSATAPIYAAHDAGIKVGSRV